MSTATNSKPFSPCNGANLAQAERGSFENIVPGIGVPVITYGGKLHFREIKVPVDTTVYEEKRDRFEKRNEFAHKVAQAGGFEYAIGYAPRIKNAADVIEKAGPKQGGFSAKCHWCGAGHNWVVFYKRVGVDGSYLGYSGMDCFGEILKNLQVPGWEAIFEAARKAEAAAKKFAKVMSKINDFKADFPGLYEHRKTLRQGYNNPYARLWQEVENRINDPSSNGIDEKWLQECQEGVYDRKERAWHTELKDKAARRIPDMLVYLSLNVKSIGLEKTLSALYEKSYEEPVGSPFRRLRPNSTPTVNAQVNATLNAPVVNIHNPAKVQAQVQAATVQRSGISANADTVEKARKLYDTKKYDWSFVVKEAALEGTLRKDSYSKMIEDWYSKEFPALVGV